MSLKLSHFYLSFLLLPLIQPFIAQSRLLQSSHHSSYFFQNLEGSQKGETVKGLKELKQYLKRFGYYPNDQNDINLTNDFDDILEDALKTYQKTYGLKVTGNLDSDTIKLISTPRCGMPDDHMIKHAGNNNSGKLHIVSHYAFFDGNPKWPSSKYHLKYTFRSDVLSDFRPAIVRAFLTWASNTKFTFEEVPETSQPDIVIGFYRWNHGDGSAFDGPHKILAHAFAPTDGRIHFDADETWSASDVDSISSNLSDLETLAVHEIGHVLGLQHSTDKNAVMFAFINYGSIKREPNDDDLEGIYVLYNYFNI